MLYVEESLNKQIDELVNTHFDKKTVIILATGGTIAGAGQMGRSTAYAPGRINIEEILNELPLIAEKSHVKALQICNINSDDMNSKLWIDMANIINRLAVNDDISGFVITHGTDTLEETAYFLNLTVKTRKPVVITGSLRPATSISADGPMNLYQSVCLASSLEAIGKGVMVVFSDQIYSARSVMKSSTFSVSAMSGGDTGSMGVIRDDQIFFYETPDKKHTVKSEFDVTDLKSLPIVHTCYFAVDADPQILRFIASKCEGLVIAGAGAGEFSKEFKEVIDSLDMPIVISSRIDGGIITQNSLLCKHTVSANNLPPQKAAILLKLALTKVHSFDELMRMFQEY